jgi:hypothetical protein
MTDYDEVLDECQRLADYWMNEQDVYDVEVVPRADEYRVTITRRSNYKDATEWFETIDEADNRLRELVSWTKFD